jgi:hypothetical protein
VYREKVTKLTNEEKQAAGAACFSVVVRNKCGEKTKYVEGNVVKNTYFSFSII